ncbi:glycoside hydrolase family 16 protein [Labilibacter sediminis]|nr:glycoside hydrolase family 16 protein [Labilibacter sediminis]
MKKLNHILIMSLVLLSVQSCIHKEKRNSTDTKAKETISILGVNEYNYEPGKDWLLAWSDEFDKDTIYANNWSFQEEEAGRFNEEWQRYTSSSANAYIDEDCLVIKAIHESDEHGMDQYTSARLHTANKLSWKYGKIAARIKLPKGNGIWPAFWMLGANIDENGGDTPWPQCGEIDILELYGSKDDAVVEGNLHYADQSGEHAMMGAVAYKLDQGIFADSFHIFELEWSKDSINWLVDRQQYATASISAQELSEFHNDYFILLNLAVGGTYAGYPDSTTTFPQYMYIDWVRVYKKDL